MNIIALDDEPLALKILESFCGRLDKVHLKKVFTNPNEALAYIQNYPVDLLLLDINMPTITGLAFYEKVKDKVQVIFTTAHHDFALNAFDLGAIDYLLKPYSFERLETAIKKAEKYTKSTVQEDKFLTFRIDYKLVQVQLNDVLYFESYDDYVKIWSNTSKVIVVRATLKSILDKLPEEDFIRVHRSFVISKKFTTSVRNKIIMVADKKIPLGKSYEEEFMRYFTPQ